MIFEDTYITDAGQALLTRAVSGTKIIWGECGCFQHTGINEMSDAEVNALTALNGMCARGQATASFEINGDEKNARVTCQCSNTEVGCSAGQALAFGLWAKLEGDAEEVLVAIARTGSYTPTTFPAYDLANILQTRLIGVVELTITIRRDAATTIRINPALYAHANDLQTEITTREDLQERFELIEDRVVTTHAYGYSEIGEQQDVYGLKEFQNGIRVHADYSDGSGGYVTFIAHNLSGGTYPGASLTVHRNSDSSDIGLNVNQIETRIKGDFKVTDSNGSNTYLSVSPSRVDIPGLAIAPEWTAYGTSVSIGQILLVHIKRIGASGLEIRAGETFSGEHYEIYSAKISQSGYSLGKGATNLSAYTFRAMNDTDLLYQNAETVIFAQRVQ